MTTRPNHYFGISTALTLTAAAVLAALLMASAPASAQEGSSFVYGTDPSDRQIGVLRDTNVEAAFWLPMDQTTITTDTFTLVKEGTTSPVEASLAYYAYCMAGDAPCSAVLNPNADLEANTTYTATLKGGENGIKDASGAQMAGDYSWSFTTGDSTAPPETTITSAPCGPKQVGGGIYWWSPCEPTTSTSASIAFVSSKADSTFECSLDDAAFTSCTSPQTYSGLSDGAHAFRVRATDASGNTDPTPASTGWTVATPVDTTAPSVSEISPAPGATKVARGTDVVATFSEAMDPTTLNTSTFKLYKCASSTDTTCATQITNAPVAPASDGRSATLNPYGTSTTLLARTTKHKVVVTTGAKDLAGNALAQRRVTYFTTGRT